MTTDDILEAIKNLTPEMQRAYLESVRLVVSSATYSEVERLIEQDDILGLTDYLALVGLPAFFEWGRRALLSGAMGELRDVPFFPPTYFDPLHAAVRLWMDETFALVRNDIQTEQANAIGIMVQAGQQQGRSVGRIARDLLGVLSPASGLRFGGTVGMAGVDAHARLAARQELTSSDVSQLRGYLRRVLRDPAYDQIIKDAIKNRRPLTAQEAYAIERGYSYRLTEHRAEVVAQMQAHAYFEAGRLAANVQALEAGALQGWYLSKTWRTVGDERVRFSHRTMDRQTVEPDDFFVSGRGALLAFPGDRSAGAGFDEVAGCRCHAIYRFTKGAPV